MDLGANNFWVTGWGIYLCPLILEVVIFRCYKKEEETWEPEKEVLINYAFTS